MKYGGKDRFKQFRGRCELIVIWVSWVLVGFRGKDAMIALSESRGVAKKKGGVVKCA